MGPESSRPTPLGVARARFVDGLPRKAAELRGSIALLASTPGEERPREELRRRLHALFASAQVFQIGPLAIVIRDSIVRLDAARDEKRALSDEDLEVLAALPGQLPELGNAEPGPMEVEGLGSSPGSIPAVARPSWMPASISSLPAPSRIASVPRPETISELPRPQPTTASMRPARSAAVTLRGIPTPSTPPESPLHIGPEAVSPLILQSEAPPPQVRIIEETKAKGAASDDPESPDTSGTSEASAAPSDVFAGSRLDTVTSLLVIDVAEWQVQLRALLPAERFEVLAAADAEEALRIARSSAPDVVIIDVGVLARAGADFVRRLRSDPLTDFVPVIVTAKPGASPEPEALRELGADDVLAKPFQAQELKGALHRVTSPARGALSGLAGEHTIEEVAARIAEEVKRGLSESADRGRDVKVPLGDGTEVLAAAWSAIGRVRAHVSSRSGGRVHFKDDRATGGPAFLTLLDDPDTEVPSAAPVSLRDRHIVVADDDPAVVWFFAGLLREEGAIVDEASDGLAALELSRKKRPDVVISDILMPRLDGFALTREFKRDPALADVPVILLSWKEDFLQRMRELQSGASGYLRKEAAASKIIECVRDVLRPRARLEAQLRAGGDVRGSLERTGIIPLIKTTAATRPDARITVRDAWNLFELDLRDGNLVDLTRTASDGSFTRGPRVVLPLLGATAGRFAITDASAPVRGSIKEPLDQVLEKGAAEIGALVDSISGKGMALASQVEFDDDVLASLLHVSPDPMRMTVDRLRSGAGPRTLLSSGEVAPHELEAVLLDLARQGAIIGVRGENGEDRIAIAVHQRGLMELPTRTPSIFPELAGPTESAAHDAEPRHPSHEEQTAKNLAETQRMAARSRHPASRRSVPAPRPGDSLPAEILELDEPETDPGPRHRPPAPPKAPRVEAEARASTEAVREPTIGRDENEREEPTPRVGLRLDANPAKIKSAELTAEKNPGSAASTRESRKPPKPVVEPEPQAEAESGMGTIGWAILLGILFIAGFVIVHRFTRTSTPEELVDAPPPADSPPVGADMEEEERAMPSEVLAVPEEPRLVRGYGEEEPGIASSYGVEVGQGQGLVVLEPGRDGSAIRVRLASRDHELGAEPVAVALEAGVHEIVFSRGEHDRAIRFVRVRAGSTRRVPPP